MKAIIALASVASIAVVFCHEQPAREQHVRQRLLPGRGLRKDFGSSDYRYESSSSKSGKGSGKSGKGSGKSSKGSKSGKSKKSSHANYYYDGYGQESSDKGVESSDVHDATSEYYSKAAKWHEKADDDDIYDLGGKSGGGSEDDLTGSSVTFGDDMFDDFADDDSDYNDDSTTWEDNSFTGESGEGKESSVIDANGAETSNGSSDGSNEDFLDDSLNQNSWLVDIIDGEVDESNNGDDVTDDNSSQAADDGAQKEDTMPASNGSDNEVFSGSETSNDVPIAMPTDASESFWGALNPSTDWTMSMPENDFSMSTDLQEDQSPDFDFDSSMSIYPLEDDFPELDQFEAEFGSLSMSTSSTDEFNNGGSGSDGSVTDGTHRDDDMVNNGGAESGNGSSDITHDVTGANGATDDNVTNDGNGDEDDRVIDESNGSKDELSHLTVQERSQIIQDKCNTSPLGRALSLIRIIGNRVDTQDMLSQSADSPQYLAFLWLVYLDDAILCPPSSQEDAAASSAFDGAEEDITRWLAKNNNSIQALSPTVYTSIMESHETLDRIIQRYSLALLYYSFHGYGWSKCPSDRNFVNTTTLGDCVNVNGYDLVRFLDSTHECSWFGVTCSLNVTENMSVDEHIPVTRLELPGTSLYGKIPQDIALLYSLETVDLRDNDLSGTIPFGAFATMNNLDTLILSGNKRLIGNADRYCESESSLSNMLIFGTDCTPLVEELKPARVQCSCCTSCL